MNEIDKPNYYAILTAEVRYNPKLSPFCKLIFAEITALSNKEGFCWATNGWFAKQYEVTEMTVIRAINRLIEHGYIQREIKEINTNNSKRILRIVSTKMIIPSNKNVNTLHNKNVTHNTMNISNIKKNISNSEFDKFWTNLQGRKLQKPSAKRAFEKIKTDLTGEELAIRFNNLFRTREEKFIPYPAKWLKNEGWEDETSIEKVDGQIIYRDKDGFIISEEEYNKIG